MLREPSYWSVRAKAIEQRRAGATQHRQLFQQDSNLEVFGGRRKDNVAALAHPGVIEGIHLNDYVLPSEQQEQHDEDQNQNFDFDVEALSDISDAT